eukprot:03682.XXX_43940_44095_1 [CDS] Oithona nana genome sequencing.
MCVLIFTNLLSFKILKQITYIIKKLFWPHLIFVLASFSSQFLIPWFSQTLG